MDAAASGRLPTERHRLVDDVRVHRRQLGLVHRQVSVGQPATNFGGKFKKLRDLRILLPDHSPDGRLPDEDEEDEDAADHVEAADHPQDNL